MPGFVSCGIRKSHRLLQTHPLQHLTYQEASKGVNENNIYAPLTTKPIHIHYQLSLFLCGCPLAVGYGAEQQHAQQQQQLFQTRHGSRWVAILVLHLACSNLQPSDEYRRTTKRSPTAAPNVSQSRERRQQQWGVNGAGRAGERASGSTLRACKFKFCFRGDRGGSVVRFANLLVSAALVVVVH